VGRFWLLLPVLGVMLFASCALAAAPAARPATRPSTALDREIARLLIELDDADARIREKATAKLINLGPRVLRPLKAAMNPDASPEFMLRAKSILAEIASQWRYVDESGGNVVGGFQATLSSKSEFQAGKPISLALVFRCVASGGGQIWETRTIDIEFPDSAALFATRESEGRLVIKKISAPDLPARASPIICNSGQPHAIDFTIGGSVNTSIWIDREFQLAPGEYEIRFIYYAHSRALLKDALEDLESNTIKIKVIAAPAMPIPAP
jgi:hypothetical protein